MISVITFILMQNYKSFIIYQKIYQMEANYYGVDLSAYECHKLTISPIYSSYKKEQLHFPIGAIQKGLKPHTQIGIKRIQKRNQNKKNRASQTLLSRTNDDMKRLCPKSTQEICMKALRRQFRTKIQSTHMSVEPDVIKTKTITKIKGKIHQQARRRQLTVLVAEHRQKLLQIFGYERMTGFNRSRCPKVSRKQIITALGLVEQIIPDITEEQIEAYQKQQNQNIKEGRRERITRPQRIVRQVRPVRNFIKRPQRPYCSVVRSASIDSDEVGFVESSKIPLSYR